MPPPLPVRHARQEEAAGCLAACAQMALESVGVNITQQQLNQLFMLTDAGVPAPRLLLLSQFHVEVVYTSGDDVLLREILDQGQPVIVFVFTGDLPFWSTNIRHAVLAVGYDDEIVYLNDPVFADAPQRVSWGDFLLAWSEFDYRYAVIRKAR